jgi:hypothetical protein
MGKGKAYVLAYKLQSDIESSIIMKKILEETILDVVSYQVCTQYSKWQKNLKNVNLVIKNRL